MPVSRNLKEPEATTRVASVTCRTRPGAVVAVDVSQHATASSLLPSPALLRPCPLSLGLSWVTLDMSKKNSPNRRRSIATLGHGHVKSTSHRRRAYSIAPGERISPAAKARRLLVSVLILKA